MVEIDKIASRITDVFRKSFTRDPGEFVDALDGLEGTVRAMLCEADQFKVPGAQDDVCVWKRNLDGEWDTRCAHEMVGDIVPGEPGNVYCSGCGKRIKVKRGGDDDRRRH